MRRPTPDPVRAGQESVWDYPRPPRLEHIDAHVVIRLGGEVILDTRDVVRVLETSHPPVYYLPVADFVATALHPVSGSSFCEYKGAAAYFDVRGGGIVAARAGWTYPDPSPGFVDLVGRVAVYAAPMDACEINGEVVTPQPGGFYGGWVTDAIAGPIKGIPGSMGW